MTTMTLKESLREFENDIATIGTDHYTGKAFYWAMEYKHALRKATQKQRIDIHNRLLKENLLLNGISNRHKEIIYSDL